MRPADEIRRRMRKLLTSSYDDDLAMISDYCKAVGLSEPRSEDIELCRDVLKRHQNSVTVRDGARTLIGFLRRRGLKLAVLSNASQPFAEAFSRLDIADLFDHVAFSCEIGLAKPAKEAYSGVCKALGVSESECVFVGDSVTNDYVVPQSLGMHAICLSSVNGVCKPEISQVADLAWRSLNTSDPLLPLFHAGKRFALCGQEWTTQSVVSLPDASQGRYNIVAKVVARNTEGVQRSFISKRYLTPNSAHVEELAYRLMDLVGLSGINHSIVSGIEPLLIMEEALGLAWEKAEIDDATIRQIGSHCALAYIIGNADIRPRNTFVNTSCTTTKVTVIDLEHCFFDRAITLPTTIDPLDPKSIDSLPEATLNELTKHRVLSPNATRRARRSFLAVEDRTLPLPQIFRDGWLDAYNRVQLSAKAILDIVHERLYQNPPLIIGTQSYRRAMARIDIEDMRARIVQNSTVAFEQQY